MIITTKKYIFEVSKESEDDEELGLAGVDSYQFLYFNEENGYYIVIDNYGSIYGYGPLNIYSSPDGVEKDCADSI